MLFLGFSLFFFLAQTESMTSMTVVVQSLGLIRNMLFDLKCTEWPLYTENVEECFPRWPPF